MILLERGAKKMKIAEVILDLRTRDGAEVFLLDLIISIKKSTNDDVFLISLYDDVDDSFLELIRKYKIKFFTCHKKAGVDLKASSKFKEIIKEINPDIIHSHRSCLLTYFFAFGFKKRKWKLVHTIHNLASYESNKVTNFLRKRYIKKRMIYFVGISDLITRSFIKIIPNGRIETIYNGINIDQRPIPDYSQRKQNIVIAARFSEQKNHQFLIKCFDIISKQNAETALICLGDGALLEKTKEQALLLKCNNKIMFTGSVSDVIPYYDDSILFVLTSLYEGNPISILEAMSRGLPIVASAVGGIPDVILDGVNGFLFEVNNENAFIEDVLKLLNDKDLRIKISNNNIEKAKTFAMDICSKHYLELFNKIMHDN